MAMRGAGGPSQTGFATETTQSAHAHSTRGEYTVARCRDMDRFRTHPPRRLVALVLTITVVPLGVFLWLGWVVNATGGTPRPVDLEIGPGHGSMRMHPDGQRVAYNTGRNGFELWRLDNFLPSAPAKVTRR